MDRASIYSFMETKRPLTNNRGRPYSKKYVILYWLFLWWIMTLIAGLIMFFFIEPRSGSVMLFISGFTWFIGTMIEAIFRN